MVNGQWPTVDGQWSMVNGQCAMTDGRWSMVNGQWSIVNGQWSMVNGQRLMVNGQWSLVNGQRLMVNGQWSMVNGQCSSVNVQTAIDLPEEACSECRLVWHLNKDEVSNLNLSYYVIFASVAFYDLYWHNHMIFMSNHVQKVKCKLLWGYICVRRVSRGTLLPGRSQGSHC